MARPASIAASSPLSRFFARAETQAVQPAQLRTAASADGVLLQIQCRLHQSRCRHPTPDGDAGQQG
jgi:hypothetical protein